MVVLSNINVASTNEAEFGTGLSIPADNSDSQSDASDESSSKKRNKKE